jgi:hypothetical protein
MSHVILQDQTAKGARGLTLAHVTDLSEGELPAFMHAVALAQRSSSTLVSIHASAGDAGPVPMPRAVLLGSHAERVLHHANCPVLLVPLK